MRVWQCVRFLRCTKPANVLGMSVRTVNSAELVMFSAGVGTGIQMRVSTAAIACSGTCVGGANRCLGW